jgi:hypothetical protein
LLLCSLGPRQAFATPQTVVRDPQALTLISASLQALTGGVTVSNVVLQANAAYVAGSDQESGTATLTASGNQQSLVQLNLTNGPRQEIRNGPAGVWSGPDGVTHWMATHNCWTDANWFFPALTLEALQSDSTLGIAYLGPAVWNGVPANHLQFFHIIPGQTAPMTAEIQSLSTIDLYLDPTALVPLALTFNTHLYNDLNANIPVVIQFGNYQRSGGVLVAFQVQKFLQGSLYLDLTLSQAAINPGVSPGTFILPEQPTGGGQ